MNGMYGMSDVERLIAVNHMQVAANHAVPSGAMPFQEVLRVYGEDQITGVGSCIDYEKRKRIGMLRIYSVCHAILTKMDTEKNFCMSYILVQTTTSILRSFLVTNWPARICCLCLNLFNGCAKARRWQTIILHTAFTAFPQKARNIFRNMPAFLSLNRVKTAPLFDLT